MLAAGCEDRREKTITIDEAVEALQINAPEGSVTVEGSDEPGVLVQVSLSGPGTKLRWELHDGQLDVWTRCRGAAPCESDYVVRVNADAFVDVTTASGEAQLSDLRGGAIVDTGSGDVVLSRVAGPVLVAETGSGSVEGTNLAVGILSAETGSGAIRLGLDEPPEALDADTGSGNAEIRVPAGTYELRLRSRSGAVRTSGIDEGPGPLVEVSTGSGSVDVIGS